MTYSLPPVAKTRATQLWLNLMESNGDADRVTDLLAEETRDHTHQTALVLFSTLAFFFTTTWPSVLRQLEQRGVSGDCVATAVGNDLIAQVSDYLRADVDAGEL